MTGVLTFRNTFTLTFTNTLALIFANTLALAFTNTLTLTFTNTLTETFTKTLTCVSNGFRAKETPFNFLLMDPTMERSQNWPDVGSQISKFC